MAYQMKKTASLTYLDQLIEKKYNNNDDDIKQ